MFNPFVRAPGFIGVKNVVIEAFSEGEAEAVTLGDCYVLGCAAALRDQFLNKAARPNLSLYQLFSLLPSHGENSVRHFHHQQLGA